MTQEQPSEQFDKFHKISHLDRHSMPDGELTIQEKMDGANAGIQLGENGTLIVHSRNRALALVTGDTVTPLMDLGTFAGLVDLAQRNHGGIATLMSEHCLSHIYGEWLVKHTLDYPDLMWNWFYVFDVQDTEGRYLNPEPLTAKLDRAGMKTVQTAVCKASQLSEGLKASMSTWSERRRIEGVVVKNYGADYRKELTRRGERHCYKVVLKEFREDHKAPKGPAFLTLEDELASYLPERSIVKLLEKLRDANGPWTKSQIPTLMHMAWQEFLEEHAAAALRACKHPVVNTLTLKTRVETRAREYALQQSAQLADEATHHLELLQAQAHG